MLMRFYNLQFLITSTKLLVASSTFFVVAEMQSDILQVVNLKGFSRKPCDAFYNEVPGKELK